MLIFSSCYKQLFIILLLQMSLMALGQGLTITAGSKLVVNGNAQIAIKDGGFTNNGSFIAGNGTIHFTGNTATANSHIGGSSATRFYNLTLNKSGNGIKLNSDINVANHVTFVSGDSLFLNNHNIYLGTTGLLMGERNNSRVTGLTGGYVQRTQVLNAAVAVNPGNLGIEITSAVSMDSTVIRRGHKQTPDMPVGSIFRYYDVQPANNAALDATIKFNYLDVETGTQPENNLMLYSSAPGDISWTFLGATTADMIQNFVTKQNLERMNKFILADLGSILPVQLIYFDAKPVNRQTLLNWKVTEEFDIDHYEIERSANGLQFISLMSIKGEHNNSGTANYTSADQHPVNGYNYYRLKMADKLNKYKYSKIVLVNFSLGVEEQVGVNPNPAHDFIKITFSSSNNELLPINIFDAKGSLVNAKAVAVIEGKNEIAWDVHALPAGVYMIQLQGSVAKTIQLIKQ